MTLKASIGDRARLRGQAKPMDFGVGGTTASQRPTPGASLDPPMGGSKVDAASGRALPQSPCWATWIDVNMGGGRVDIDGLTATTGQERIELWNATDDRPCREDRHRWPHGLIITSIRMILDPPGDRDSLQRIWAHPQEYSLETAGPNDEPRRRFGWWPTAAFVVRLLAWQDGAKIADTIPLRPLYVPYGTLYGLSLTIGDGPRSWGEPPYGFEVRMLKVIL
jgi:hypothetical protein